LIHLLLAPVESEPQSERDEDGTHRPIDAEAGSMARRPDTPLRYERSAPYLRPE
jgi:hypothetical protein